MFRVCIRDAPHDAHDEPHVSRCASVSAAGKETLREVFFSFLSFSSRAHAAHRVIARRPPRASSSRAGATHRTCTSRPRRTRAAFPSRRRSRRSTRSLVDARSALEAVAGEEHDDGAPRRRAASAGVVGGGGGARRRRRRHPPQRHRRQAQGGRQRRALRKRHRALSFFVTKGPSVVVRRAVEPDRAFKRGERARGFARARRQTQSSVGADAGLGSAVFRGVRREHAQRVRPRGERARGHAARPQTRHARRVSRRVEAAAAVLAQGLARDVHDDGHVNLATFSPRRSCGLAVSSSRGNAIGGVESGGRAERASSARLVVILVRAPRAGWTHRRGVGGREAAGAWHARVRVGVVREPHDRKPKTLVDDETRHSGVSTSPGVWGSSQPDQSTPRVSPGFEGRYVRMPLARYCARRSRAGWRCGVRSPSARARACRRSPRAAPFAGVPS